MRTNSISHSKIPKLNLNFNHSTKNSTYVKKKPLNNLKYDFNGRNNLQKSQSLRNRKYHIKRNCNEFLLMDRIFYF